MTISKLYSIRDTITDSYEPPFTSVNDETAKRMFARIIKNVPTIYDNPQDFSLHSVGTFDSSNGNVYQFPAVQFIISGLNCVKPFETNLTGLNPEASNNETTKVGDDSPVQSST